MNCDPWVWLDDMTQFNRVGNGEEESDQDGEFSRLLDEYQQSLERGTVSTFWDDRICSQDVRDRITQIGSTVGEVELYFADEQMKSPLTPELFFVGKGLPGFEIERELGRGSNGIVFLALDTSLNRHVAIKIPRLSSLGSASARKRFRREAQLAACIDHPHVLPIFEIGMRRDARNNDSTPPDTDNQPPQST
jgi:serine/threonine protein kinase